MLFFRERERCHWEGRGDGCSSAKGVPVGGDGGGGGAWVGETWVGRVGIGEWVLGWVLGCCEWERHGSGS